MKGPLTETLSVTWRHMKSKERTFVPIILVGVSHQHSYLTQLGSFSVSCRGSYIVHEVFVVTDEKYTTTSTRKDRTRVFPPLVSE